MVRPNVLKDEHFEGVRGRLAAFVENPRFSQAIAMLILLNAFLLGIETDPWIRFSYGPLIQAVDYVILAVFVMELVLKLWLYRLAFFRDGWNLFDFAIVGGSLFSVGGTMSILRTLRIFRALRLMTIVPSMRRVLTALFNAVPGMTSILGIMTIVFYVAAVLATTIFGASPDPQMQALFGTMGTSMMTLFQIMTLENWPDIAAPTMALFPWAWVYFVLFIVVTSFAILNLFVGIIVDAMDIVHDFEEENKGVKDLVHKEAEGLHSDLASLQREMAEIKALLRAGRSGQDAL